MFVPLAAAIVLLFLALGLVALWSERRSEDERIDREVDAAARLFELRLASDVEAMQVAMEPFLSDPAILDRFEAGDRDGLLALVETRFADMQARHGVSHMYFVGPDRVTFLRVHQPERRDDVIDRYTMREAQRTGGLAAGLELGPLGTLTLRVVSPLRRGDRVVGYFELGREVEHYAADIRRTLGTEMYVLVRKDLLDHERWVEGQEMLGRGAQWDRFEDYVMTGQGGADQDLLARALPRALRADGESIQVQLDDGRHAALGVRPLLDASGEHVGVLAVAVDATGAVETFRRTLAVFLAVFAVFAAVKVMILFRVVTRTEQSLRRAEAVEARGKSELEGRVRERTAQLEREIAERESAQAQLSQAQKMEMIGQLTGGVAHDFNNLLAIIMSDLEYLRMHFADQGIDELIEGAWEAAERGGALIARLLAVSRRQPLSPQPVDANALVDGLRPLLERAVPRGIELEIERAPGLWRCFVDPAQLENLVLNLVVNARDAMPDGGRVSVTTGNRRVSRDEALEWGIEPGDYVELRVRDTGRGIPAEVLERVFDPFFTTKEVGKGSGLGLSMVHGTAKQSGGHVAIDSEVGVGTTVRLLLPRADAPESSA